MGTLTIDTILDLVEIWTRNHSQLKISKKLFRKKACSIKIYQSVKVNLLMFKQNNLVLRAGKHKIVLSAPEKRKSSE